MTKLEQLEKIANGFMQAKILLAAAELRVFERLRAPGATAEALVRAHDWDLRATEILLDALCAMELVQKDGEVYRNDSGFETHLVEDAPGQFVAMLRHRNLMFRDWAHIEDRVRGAGGFGAARRPQIADPGANENFIRAMYAASHASAAAVAERIGLDGVRSAADLGGGPGHYLVEFLRRAPGLEPYLIDLPLTLEVARRILADVPECEKIRFVAWDFYADPVPEGLPEFDLVFVSQVLHAETPGANLDLFRKLRPRVALGGRLVVHENVVDPSRTSPRAAAIFAVNMLAMTPGGRTYTEREIVEWGIEAGFEFERAERVGERSFLISFRRRG